MFRRLRLPSSRSRPLSSLPPGAAEDPLALFGEAKEAARLMAAGRPDLAEPLLRRTVDVCAHVTALPLLATAARRRCDRVCVMRCRGA